MTGGSGLVGAYAVRMLLDRGERPVVYDVAVNERLLEAVGVESGKVTAIRTTGIIGKVCPDSQEFCKPCKGC